MGSFLINSYFFKGLFIVLFFCNLKAEHEWTFMVYMQARNELDDVAWQNCIELASGVDSRQVKFLVQSETLNQDGFKRYQVSQNKIEQVAFVLGQDKGDPSEKIVEFVSWAKEQYNAKKYALVLWGCGAGILDQSF